MSKAKVIIFTTKTLHHYYLIKILNENKKIDLTIFFIDDKKEKLTKKQYDFEKLQFFNNSKYKIKNKSFLFKEINSKKVLRKISKEDPFIGILFGTKKVSQDFINLFDNKLINIHRGIMEKYRGLDSEFWSSYFEDFNFIGTTIHLVNEQLDMGKIIYQKKLILKKNMKCYQLRCFTTLIAAKKINQIIQKFLSKKIVFKKKQQIGKYFSNIQDSKKKIAFENFDKYCKNL